VNNLCFNLLILTGKCRDCAAKIVEGIMPKLGDLMEEPEIAGPGFINL
jgi:hypothetical protein